MHLPPPPQPPLYVLSFCIDPTKIKCYMYVFANGDYFSQQSHCCCSDSSKASSKSKAFSVQPFAINSLTWVFLDYHEHATNWRVEASIAKRDFVLKTLREIPTWLVHRNGLRILPTITYTDISQRKESLCGQYRQENNAVRGHVACENYFKTDLK